MLSYLDVFLTLTFLGSILAFGILMVVTLRTAEHHDEPHP